MRLERGHATVSSSFVLRSADRKSTVTFKPLPGEEFVVLFLGAVKKGADVDARKMLEEIGFSDAEVKP